MGDAERSRTTAAPDWAERKSRSSSASRRPRGRGPVQDDAAAWIDDEIGRFAASDPRKGWKLNDDQCFRCMKTGHRGRECPNLMVCRHCRVHDHTLRTCTRKRDPAQMVVLPQSVWDGVQLLPRDSDTTRGGPTFARLMELTRQHSGGPKPPGATTVPAGRGHAAGRQDQPRAPLPRPATPGHASACKFARCGHAPCNGGKPSGWGTRAHDAQSS